MFIIKTTSIILNFNKNFRLKKKITKFKHFKSIIYNNMIRSKYILNINLL